MPLCHLRAEQSPAPTAAGGAKPYPYCGGRSRAPPLLFHYCIQKI